MLQNIRENMQGLMAKFIITIMIIPFAFFGVQSLLGDGGGQLNVAAVNGEDISASELEGAIISQKRRLLEMMGDRADPSLLDDNLLREPALNQIIQNKLLIQAANASSIGFSPESIDESIIAMSDFQEDGVFSPQIYQNILRSNGYSAAYFKQLLKNDMVVKQLNSGMSGSEFSSQKDLSEIVKIVSQKRSYRYLTVPLAQVSDGIEISNDIVESYFRENPDQFQTEDRLKLSYIEIKTSDFFKPLEEEAIKEAYNLELKNFEAESERRASHILIEMNDERDEGQAEELIAEIKVKLAAGANFEDLVAQYSDDAGSVMGGGDLGYTTGATFPQSFEDALFSLTLNEVSGPVLTDSGYHLIKATEVSELSAPSYEDRKEALVLSLQKAGAEREFVTTVEELKDLVFNSENLQDPAAELGLMVSMSDWISRSDAPSPLSNPQVLSAAYSDDVLSEGNNSEVIELANDHYIVISLNEHDQPHTKDLADVREDIVQNLSKDQSIIKAQEVANEILLELKSKAMSDISKERGYPWQVQLSTSRNVGTASREVQGLVFAMPELNGEPIMDVKTLRSGDVVVVKLESVIDGDIGDLTRAEKNSLSSEIQRNYANQSFNSFVQSLRSAAEVEFF
jgi:peptidyl-prolyl cis-trans isomerase D